MIINRLISGVAILGIVCSLITFYLYQSTSSKLSLLQEQHTQLQTKFDEVSESKVKIIESNQVTEQVVFDNQTKTKALDTKEGNYIKELNAIPKDCPPVVAKGDKNVKKDNVAGNDSNLSDEFAGLLDKVYHEGSSSPSL